MSVLNRKLRRDLVQNAAVLIAVIAIIAVGTGLFIGLGSAQRILQTSQAAYYRDYRFADLWVDLKKAPLTAVTRVARFPSIAVAEPRIVFDVIIDIEGVVEPIGGRLISAPANRFDQTLNGLCLMRGSGFSDDRDEEVIISEPFAKAHGLEPGDRLRAILNRKRESFVIVGTAISPEFVYMVRGEGDFTPDPQHFGILYIKERYAQEVLDFEDACNQIVARVVADPDLRIESLLEKIDRTLEPYGVLATTPRSRQASHRFLSDEITGLGVTAAIMSTVFLLVAALVLNIVMTRFAERQRSIVGTLKAMGYSNREVMTHFLAFGGAVGCVGGLAGIGLGVLLAKGLIAMYPAFFEFPNFIYRSHPDLFVIGLSLSILFSLGGALRGTRSALRLQPAEAMRPKPPARGGAVFLEHFDGLWRRLGFRSHIALRQLLRNRTRTATGVLSTALATAIILMTFMQYDALWYLIDFQFSEVLRSDVDIGMRDAKSMQALYEARRLPAVDRAEPLLGVVCDLRHGRSSRRLAVVGLAKEHRLTVPRARDLSPIEIPEHGLVLGTKLAELLHAGLGDRLELTPVRGRRRTVAVPVTSVVESFLGLDCYAELGYLSGLVGEAWAVNSMQLAVNPSRADQLYEALKRLPNAQGFTARANTRANIEGTMAETLGVSFGLMIVFAGVLSLGTMINSSLIEIADRERDVATFRVLGYEIGQIAGIFLRQNIIVFLMGLILALPLGYGMTLAVAGAYNTELFRMPVVFKTGSIVTTAAISFVFVIVAQAFVYRRISKLDWLEAVQAKE
jgi:putative ABC transport system permease protein